MSINSKTDTRIPLSNLTPKENQEFQKFVDSSMKMMEDYICARTSDGKVPTRHSCACIDGGACDYCLRN